jgi:phosphatidylglycerophosphate synthase
MLEDDSARTRRGPLLAAFARGEAAILLLLLAMLLASRQIMHFSAAFPWKVLGVFLAASAVILVLAIRHSPKAAFGPANLVTLGRASLIAVLLGLIGEAGVGWYPVVIASVALALDGVDGWLARRLNCATEFGARFDMETDTVLLLALAALAWQQDKAGAWVLLAGLMRYGFVGAGFACPWLRRSLPPRRRRQTLFVVQAIALIASVSPLFPYPLSSGIALAGLLMLSVSFGIDIAYLVSQRGDRARQSAA